MDNLSCSEFPGSGKRGRFGLLLQKLPSGCYTSSYAIAFISPLNIQNSIFLCHIHPCVYLIIVGSFNFLNIHISLLPVNGIQNLTATVQKISANNSAPLGRTFDITGWRMRVLECTCMYWYILICSRKEPHFSLMTHWCPQSLEQWGGPHNYLDLFGPHVKSMKNIPSPWNALIWRWEGKLVSF